MGIYRLSNGTVRNAVACAVLSAKKRNARDPLRTADTTTATFARHRRRVPAVALILFAIAPFSIIAAGKDRSATQLPGYRAVRVHYGPMNKMIMSVRINGRPANLLVDTGASQIILDNDVAELVGVRPFQRAMNQVRFSVPTQVFKMGSEINGQILPVGLAQNIAAGSMNFGSHAVALRDSTQSRNDAGEVDGMLGLDILFRIKP